MASRRAGHTCGCCSAAVLSCAVNAHQKWCEANEKEITCGDGCYDKAKVAVHMDEALVLHGAGIISVARAHIMAMAAIDGVDVVVVDSHSLSDKVSLYEGVPRVVGEGHCYLGEVHESWRDLVAQRLLMSDEASARMSSPAR